MIKISDRVYAETKYHGANVGCVITQEGLVLVESPMLPEDARDWREQLRTVTDKEIAYLISTDHHFDHVLGNGFLTRRTIAHRIAHKGIKYLEDNLQREFDNFFPGLYEQRKAEFSQIPVVLPQITFEQKLNLFMGDRTIELTHVGGHSAATIMIYVPDEKVAFTGDNVETGQHSYAGHGRFSLWIEMLRNLEQMDVKTIVPGHGDLCGLQGARRMRSYFEALRDQVKKVREAGNRREEAAQKVDLVSYSPANTPENSKEEVLRQIAVDVAIMYDQLEKGWI